MGPQRQKGIYIGYDSTSIIRFLEPATTHVFMVRYMDYQFCEEIFPPLQTMKNLVALAHQLELKWQMQNIFTNDPRTRQADEEVRCILHLKEMLEKLPDAFNDAATMTCSHVEVENAPARLQMDHGPASKAAPCAKRGCPPGSRDTQPR